jgi:hypothetical protein
MNDVAIIDDTQYNLLIGQLYSNDSYFNPVKDCNDKWIISTEEINECVNPLFLWVKDLPLTPWCGPYVPISGSTFN